jgi:hypothetical protein
MIRMSHERGEDEWITSPIIVCDFCREEITDCAEANLLWIPAEPDQQYHTHKRCNHQFESLLPRLRGQEWLQFYWMPLEDFLDFVGHNTRFDTSKQARKQREALMCIGSRSAWKRSASSKV